LKLLLCWHLTRRVRGDTPRLRQCSTASVRTQRQREHGRATNTACRQEGARIAHTAGQRAGAGRRAQGAGSALPARAHGAQGAGQAGKCGDRRGGRRAAAQHMQATSYSSELLRGPKRNPKRTEWYQEPAVRTRSMMPATPAESTGDGHGACVARSIHLRMSDRSSSVSAPRQSKPKAPPPWPRARTSCRHTPRCAKQASARNHAPPIFPGIAVRREQHAA